MARLNVMKHKDWLEAVQDCLKRFLDAWLIRTKGEKNSFYFAAQDELRTLEATNIGLTTGHLELADYQWDYICSICHSRKVRFGCFEATRSKKC